MVGPNRGLLLVTLALALLASVLASAALAAPLADSVILATAQAYQATIWTQDAHFQNTPGVKFVQRQQ